VSPVLSPELRDQAEAVCARYPERRSALMPLLYLVQSVEGWVSRDGMREVADVLGITTAEVEAVATFYTMYRLRPTGDYVLSICTNISCALLGAKGLYERAREELGPGAEERSADGKLSLHEEECLGACDAAPVVQVNFHNYGRVTEERLVEIVAGCRDGSPPTPDLGEVPRPLKEVSRILAGLGSVPAPAPAPTAEEGRPERGDG
jgi:NADH-quinone oxidoreductase subunit E